MAPCLRVPCLTLHPTNPIPLPSSAISSPPSSGLYSARLTSPIGRLPFNSCQMSKENRKHDDSAGNPPRRYTPCSQPRSPPRFPLSPSSTVSRKCDNGRTLCVAYGIKTKTDVTISRPPRRIQTPNPPVVTITSTPPALRHHTPTSHSPLHPSTPTTPYPRHHDS